MSTDAIILKRSPVVFLKIIILIEFLFAFLPIFLALIFQATAANYFNASFLAQILSFNLFVVFMVMVWQIIAIGLAFVIWFVPAYNITPENIILTRGGILADLEIARTPEILGIEVEQGWLGRKLGYGSLTLKLADSERHGRISNIPDPHRLKRAIERMETAVARPENWHPGKSLPDLIHDGESQYLEFKSSLLWDYRQQRPNKNLHLSVMKNIAAFLNTQGGAILIGVGDDGEILGIEPDMQVMKKKDTDSFENSFNVAFNQMIGADFRRFVRVSFPKLDSKTICAVIVQPASMPAYLTHKGQEDFYIKTGNSSQPLTVSQAVRYIQSHFSER
ncbi:MAG: PH domain-containing protein [Chloroflexi bacterium]|nr:PH domain-containing protein [Chloroflexota bacterium]